MRIKKILIANRGEIACRVIKTAKKMGIKTVAVFSDVDRDALHVKMADEAVHIGPPPAAESYIVIEKILDAIKQSGADAVHPGYGFLSENPKFAEALEKEKIAFIGPPVGAIKAMGDKITSKKLAAEAGVSTVPGFMGLIKDADEAVKISKQVGYPVMIKASAGGGGKGMRIAQNDEEARQGFQSSKNEAKNSFGDDRIFIEKFITQPRHIEIQVLGDSHGNCIYLGERECSIQRRNQKVIEEAPSPFLDEETRKAMGEQAVALAKAVDYASAGTVEFIVDGDKNFYFLEMNTRLQVEHPVTELITGIDLVEQMIRVAADEKLAIKQSDVMLNGWAIESRLYAEDPYRNFLPSIGRLSTYRPPEEGVREDGSIIRNDTGVFEGGEISMFYDPMIAKLCSWAKDRQSAIAAMEDALDGFQLEGIGHNLPFLSAVMAHEKFITGDLSTGFIAEEYPDGFSGVTLSKAQMRDLAAIAAAANAIHLQRAAQIGSVLKHHKRKIPDNWIIQIKEAGGIGKTEFPLVFKGGDQTRQKEDEQGFEILHSGAKKPETLNLNGWRPGQNMVHAVFGSGKTARHLTVKIERKTQGYRLRYRGADIRFFCRTPRQAELALLMPVKTPPDTSKQLLCPMPGLIVSINVSEGEEVQEGQPLATVEAMKMENILCAEKKGRVAKINASPGDSLAVDEVIMEFG